MVAFQVASVESRDQPEIMIVEGAEAAEGRTEVNDRKYGSGKWQVIGLYSLDGSLSGKEEAALELAWKIEVLSAGSIPTGTILQSAFRHGWLTGVAKTSWEQPLAHDSSRVTQGAYELLCDIDLASKGEIPMQALLKAISRNGWTLANQAAVAADSRKSTSGY
jgi:hypothetical protein